MKLKKTGSLSRVCMHEREVCCDHLSVLQHARVLAAILVRNAYSQQQVLEDKSLIRCSRAEAPTQLPAGNHVCIWLH